MYDWGIRDAPDASRIFLERVQLGFVKRQQSPGSREVAFMLNKENIKSEYLLEMIGLTKTFPGVKALDGVNLRVRPGTVHALMGENGAGKSTLMKCLFGIYRRDEGNIILNGEAVEFTSSRHALDHGVSMVHQELNQVQSTRVMDNIWLGRFPRKGLFIDEDAMYEETLRIFKELDIKVDPREKVGNLPVSESQMVEIAKAVSYNSKVIVMDEPTSSLTEKEVGHLFKIIRSLRDRGVSIIYISHKMEEISEISDDVTIMRDGQWIATESIENITTDEIINLMVGRDLTHRFPPNTNEPGEVMLKVDGFTSYVENSVKDVSFELREGEILGVAVWLVLRELNLLKQFSVYVISQLDSCICVERQLKIKIHILLLRTDLP